MKKKVLIMCVGLLTVVSMAQATAIRSISITNTGTSFAGGSGVLTMGGVGGINVEYDDIPGTTITYVGGQFSLNTTRTLDTSSGVMASANFAGGSFSYKDVGSITLLSGSITSFTLTEFVNNSGMFVGTGYFTVTGGTLQGDFGTAGSLVDISYSVQPSTIANFSTSFTGSSNMTVLPIPEPATIALLIPAILALRNKRNGK